MGPRVRIGAPGGEGRWARYAEAVRRAGGRPCPLEDGGPFDAILLPGGGDIEPWRYGQTPVDVRGADPERDALEASLIREAAARRIPALGICRGMQSIAVAFGGTLCQDVPGHGQIGGADRIHGTRTAPGPLREILGERPAVNSAHHQAVDRPGTGLVPAQWAGDGIVEALLHETLPIWGVQWHPERLDGAAGTALFRAFLALCSR